ncbi:MAG TPA: lysylphosphatidylglycerol synthase domain-containing protein [Ramlibacter sp.]|nr:lysylphosphatidylglycerol synthase domain-containing protein [Ramlibacter sp.]
MSFARGLQRPHGARGNQGPAAPPSGAPRKPHLWWVWCKRILTAAFFVVVAVFIVRYARNVDWREVWQSVREKPPEVLLLAAALSALTHLVYSCMDLLGRRYTGHAISKRKVMRVNFVSYAFNLNLGSLVGAVGMRLRLYSRLGLNNPTITRVITLSMISNWLGYIVLAGLAFCIAPLELPPHWTLGSEGLRWLGAAMLLTAALYISLCLGSKKRSFMVRGHELWLPPPKMVLAQLVIACAHWLAMAGILFILLRQQVPYHAVLSVMLIGAVAGVIAHVPAGLGVLEAVFLGLLSHRVAEAQLLGVLLTYRALYYIAPLGLALVLYAHLEARAPSRKHTKTPAPNPPDR